MFLDDTNSSSTGSNTDKCDLPEPLVTNKQEQSEAMAGGMCKDPLVDLVHVTGSNNEFFILDATASDDLDAETQLVEQWLSEYRKEHQAAFVIIDPEMLEANTLARMQKLEEGIDLGIVALGKPNDTNEKEKGTLSQDDIEGLITSLENDRKAIEGHSPSLLDMNYLAATYSDLKKARLTMIDTELKRLKTNQTKMPKDSKTFAGFGERKYTLGKTVDKQKAYKKNKQGFEIVELTRASKPDKFYYVRKSYSEKNLYGGSVRVKRHTFKKEVKDVVKQKGDAKALASAMKKDIEEAIKTSYSDYKADPLKATAFKFFEIKSTEDNALNALHLELLNYDSMENDPDKIIGVTAEAHALRFAAAATAEVSGFDRATMGGALSMKTNAAFSILEASIGSSVILPRAAGYECYITYKNAQGKEIYHRFGAFRIKGEIVLSCFAGAKANASGEVSIQLKPGEAGKKPEGREVASGATALLDPHAAVGVTPGGNVGLKGGVFAGAEAGGSVSGAIEWQHPKEKSFVKGKWNALADIKAAGAVQVGAGLSGSFQVGIEGGDFIFTAHGSLAFGPGAGGEFSVGVDLSQIYDLLMVVVDILQDIDYRYLMAIDEKAYVVFYQGLYKYYTDPEAVFEDVYEVVNDIEDWWDLRSADQAEAYALANSINSGSKKWAVDKLVPELIGPMLYTLTKTWILMGETQQTAQEEAIVKLLSTIKSWRLFSESLQRMSEDGSKHDSSSPEKKADILFTGLERLNSILDGRQQQQFNRWVSQLEHRQPGQIAEDNIVAALPFEPHNQPYLKRKQVQQQVMIAWHNDLPSDQRYV